MVPETGGPYHQEGVQRVLTSRDETRAYYDKIARVYDLLAERSEEPMRRLGLEMLAARLGKMWILVEIILGTKESS